MIQPSPAPIRDMFEALVPEYDRFNKLTSLGMDSYWRADVARQFHREAAILDVGTGTGDLAREIGERGNKVVGVDFSPKMVEAARKKLDAMENVSFQVAVADDLPFEPRAFNGVVSAFVIRNLYHAKILQQSFREFYRVLKPNGQMVHLELTRPHPGLMAWGHKTYLKTVVPFIGKYLFKERWPENYLMQTIESFPTPQVLCQQIRWAGFEQVRHYPLSGGIAGLFVGVRC